MTKPLKPHVFINYQYCITYYSLNQNSFNTFANDYNIRISWFLRAKVNQIEAVYEMGSVEWYLKNIFCYILISRGFQMDTKDKLHYGIKIHWICV